MSLPLALAPLMSAMAAAAPTIGAGLSVASAGTGYLSARGAAKGQEQSNEIASESARQNMIAEYDSTTRMMLQETKGATEKNNQNQIASAKTAAAAQTAASAGGVSGLSVDALLTDIYGQEASIRDGVNQNLENTGKQISAERDGTRRRYKSTLNSMPAVSKPSVVAYGLRAATGVYGAYKDTIKVRGGTSKT